MIIPNVPEKTFDTLRVHLVETHQAEMTGTTDGVITGHGVTVNYRYDAAKQTLAIDIVHHPFFVPASMIEAQITAAAANAQLASKV
jgi:hypothetical protein